MAKIIIKRKKEFNNWSSQYSICLDGQRIGTISNGEIKEFEVPDGEHVILTKIKWCSSPTINFKLEQNKTFVIEGFKYSQLLIPLFSGLLAFHLILKYTLNYEKLIFLSFPLMLLLLFYLTIGHRKYLRLKEI